MSLFDSPEQTNSRLFFFLWITEPIHRTVGVSTNAPAAGLIFERLAPAGTTSRQQYYFLNHQDSLLNLLAFQFRSVIL